MTIWRFSLFALIGLAGCAEGLGGPGQDAPPLRQAELARGAVRVAAPDGYCIDPRSLRARFAAIARCDTLGDTANVHDAALALVTISLAPLAGAALSGDATSLAAESELLDAHQTEGLILARLRGAPLQPGFSEIYWRGMGEINDFAVGLAIYAPENSSLTRQPGAEFLDEIMQGLQRDNLQNDAGAETSDTQTSLSQRLMSLFS